MKRAIEKNADEAEKFQKALLRQPIEEHYVLCLFVAGSTPRSLRAIQNIRGICEESLQGRYKLQVIDIYQHPELATLEQVVVTPTLIKKLPLPLRQLIGDLSDMDRLLLGLNIISTKRRSPAAK